MSIKLPIFISRIVLIAVFTYIISLLVGYRFLSPTFAQGFGDSGSGNAFRTCLSETKDTWWHDNCSDCRNGASVTCTVKGVDGLSASEVCTPIDSPGCGCKASKSGFDCPGNPTEATCQAQGKRLIDKGDVTFDCGINNKYGGGCTNTGTCKKKECGDATCTPDNAETVCKTGEVCKDGKCLPGDSCKTDEDCKKGEICEKEKCVPGCRTNEDCENGKSCDPATKKCGPCTKDSDCEGEEICDPDTKTCKDPCKSDTDCGGGKCCEKGKCKDCGASPPPTGGCDPTELNCGYIDCKNCIESSGYDQTKEFGSCRWGGNGSGSGVEKIEECGTQYVSQNYCKVYVPQKVIGVGGGKAVWGLQNRWQSWGGISGTGCYGKSAPSDKACWEKDTSKHYYLQHDGSEGKFDTESAVCTNSGGTCPVDPIGDPWYTREPKINARYENTTFSSRGECWEPRCAWGSQYRELYCVPPCSGRAARAWVKDCQNKGRCGQDCSVEKGAKTESALNGKDSCSWTEYVHSQKKVGEYQYTRKTCNYEQRECTGGWVYQTCTDDDGDEYDCSYCRRWECVRNSLDTVTSCECVEDKKDIKQSGCASTSLCERRIQGTYELNEGSMWESKNSGQSCEQPEKFKIIFNEETGCPADYSVSPGATQHDQFSPCECQTDLYTVDYALDAANPNGTRFNNENGQCILKWSNQIDIDSVANVNGRGSLWGEAGSFGHYILEPVPGANGKDINGWEWDSANCRFTCEGSDSGADCYGTGDIAKATIKFVPDLRLVVYNDPAFTSQYTGVKTSPSNNNNCTSGLSTQEQPIDTTLSHGGIDVPRQYAHYYFSPNGSDSYKYNYNPYLDIARARNGFNDQAFWTDMIDGTNLQKQKGQSQTIRIELHNEYSQQNEAGYWACVCPYKDPDNPVTDDCRLQYTPVTDKNICTTKRIYLGYRDCYTAAWWQVSGGNVYAYNDIIDHVPNNLADGSYCDNATDRPENKCVDTNAPGDQPANDIKYNEPTNNRVPGDQSCTPRIIRGRTPCKTDGPSNSAGIALTQKGKVIAADVNNYYFNNSSKLGSGSKRQLMQEELKARVSERSKVHALYAGSYGVNSTIGSNNNNTNNSNGQQALVTNSRVIPYLQTNGEPLTDNGFKPPREDYRYFLTLAGGEDNIAKISGNPSIHLNALINNGQCPVVSETTTEQERVCIIDSSLNISIENPWHLKTFAGKYQKLTVFVNGDLVMRSNSSPNYANSNSATAVDIGNFLAFIVKGNIDVEPEVGITMPNPQEGSTNLGVCWEGQSATLPSFSPEANVTRQNSVTGTAEGIFIADGNFTTKRFDNPNLCLTDKRFIGQGSFISWGSVRLLRDFSTREAACQNDYYGVYNNRVPAETFIYRPDLVRNAPTWMQRSYVTYQEITGGK